MIPNPDINTPPDTLDEDGEYDVFYDDEDTNSFGLEEDDDDETSE